jgi:hypothetical protein
MSVTLTSALSEVSTAQLDLARDVPRVAKCPLCHTMHSSLTGAGLEAGGDWHCVRCGQHWNAVRLATDAAYAAWVVEHDR